MHLRRTNRSPDQQQRGPKGPKGQQKEQLFEFAEPKAPEKVEPSFDWNKLTLPKEVRELALQRKALAKKMQEIENRLRFGYSEPLYEYKMELIKEDIGLSCKITEKLVTL